MAFREVRTYFRMSSKEAGLELTRALGNPFTFYMDAVMRGKFKSYSGPEAKGVNIVNLFLCEDKVFRERRTVEPQIAWRPMLNSYQRETTFEFQRLQGNREERIDILIDVFTRQAEESSLPQMQILVEHIKKSRGKTSINESIKRADEYLTALNARVQSKQ